MDERIIAALTRCPLFLDMDNHDIDLLIEHVAQRRVILKKGEIYTTAGMACRYADIIIKGELATRMTGKSGKEVEVSRLERGNIIAPAFIYAKHNNMPVTVIASTDTEILRMEPSELSRLIGEYPQIRNNFISTLSNLNVFLTRKIRTLSLLTAKEKIARLIIEESLRHKSAKISLNKSRQEIADSFGIQKYSIIRALDDLINEGAIQVKGREITIIDRGKLQ